ncbi:MAG TPA: aldehyde dehydrogenase family protein [Myxococcota bacterium]|jgi:aldehyde dehydrogenase (NAD+)
MTLIETTDKPAPASDISLIPEQVAALRTSFESGKTRPLAWRRGQLQALDQLVSEGSGELLEALKQDLRKPALEAWSADVGFVKQEVRLTLKKLAKWTRPERVATPIHLRPAKSRIVREPLGVVLIIAPWNYPVQLLLGPLVGAIAAGNCAVLKPSEVAAHTSGVLAKLVRRYLDPECFAVFEGGVPETQAILAERFDHVFYTGNGSVAREVMTAAARFLTPVTLELGGKSPCIIDRDVDLEVAARRIAWGKFMNAGQTCIAPDYVLVHRERENDLIEALRRTLREFYGEDPGRSQDFARIPNVRHHRRLAALLKDGDVAVGGQTDEADGYIAPTVLRNPKPDSPLMTDEIFGPILPVLAVDDVAAAIEYVNQRPKPLALYLFSNDAKAEEQVLSGTSSGGVCVNSTLFHIANPELPFGGVGPSGMGAYHGRATFELFSHHKSVLTRGTRFDPKLMYPPYTKLKAALLKRLA